MSNYRTIFSAIFILFFQLNILDSLLAKNQSDWLINKVTTPVTIEREANSITISNDIISRTWYVGESIGCISFKNLCSDAEFVRSIQPEAIVTIDGKEYQVGGILHDKVHNYIDTKWLPEMKSKSGAFIFKGMRESLPESDIQWQPRYGAPDTPFPPKGKRLTLEFDPPENFGQAIKVFVHYEMYEGVPVMAKWIEVENHSDQEIKIDRMMAEILAVNKDQKENLYMESSYSCYFVQTTFWEDDSLYETAVGDRNTLLFSRYPIGPAKRLAPGESFTSFVTYEILNDNNDPERQGLARRKMYRTLFPWTQENPIFMHLRNSDSESIRNAVDQCVEVGFEMIIITFWSGFDMISKDQAYWDRIKADFDYAHSKGIKIGGYILFSSTADYGEKYNAVQDVYPPSLCLGSEYVDEYYDHLFKFMDYVGQDVIETDGPYHGYPCHSTDHKYHDGYEDSKRVNWEKQAEFFKRCRNNGIYINAPDWYFATGSNKTAMGYREENWSLPREFQIVIGRQNVYDGTWAKIPSQGWMMTPLVQYHGGGESATLEPLKEHRREYEAHLIQNFGSGVQSCYRGPRLYDSEETKAMVKRVVDWYKKYRAILNSDIIHVRRPDGRDLDCMLHVNPDLKEKGLAMIYNPTDEMITKTISLPLYYTGLTDVAMIREGEGKPKKYKLDREYNVELEMEVPARGYNWYVIE